MSRILPLISNKVHLTLYGFQTMTNIVRGYPNKRSSSKEFWLDLIESWFKFQATKSKSGENNIQVVSGRNSSKGQTIAWKCVFPKESNLKSQQFTYSVYKDSNLALKEAIKYRDITIKNWVDSLK
jgi:hypothetical protein